MQYPTYALPVHFTVSHSTGRLTTKPYQTPPQPPQRHMHNPGESKQGTPHQKHAQNNKLHKAIHISSSPCLDDVKSNKQEGTLASYMKRKKTSSKIVVWCVRCPQGTFWQVHHRVAQQSPSRTNHAANKRHKIAKQTKPHGNTRSTINLKAIYTCLCAGAVTRPRLLAYLPHLASPIIYQHRGPTERLPFIRLTDTQILKTKLLSLHYHHYLEGGTQRQELALQAEYGWEGCESKS